MLGVNQHVLNINIIEINAMKHIGTKHFHITLGENISI